MTSRRATAIRSATSATWIGIALLSIASGTIHAQPEGKRWALVVGINEYSRPDVSPLQYAVNDARSMVKTLIELGGFAQDNIFVMTSEEPPQDKPTLGNLLSRLNFLADKVQSQDTFLFYFSGHGISVDGKPYLLTMDADPRSVSSLEVSSLKVGLLREKLQAISAARTIIVMDSCQSDPRGGRGLGSNPLAGEFVKGIEVVPRETPAAGKGLVALLFACSVGQRAYEWPDRKQGFFTYQLVQGLRGGAKDSGKVTLGTLTDFVKKTVPDLTGDLLGDEGRQMPTEVFLPDADTCRKLVLIIEKPPVGTYTPPTEAVPVVRPPQEVLDVLPAGSTVNPTDGAVMVLVPGGPFTMGSSEGESVEQPAHKVTLNKFWIYQREVTNEQFLRFVEATGYEAEGDWKLLATEAGRLNHPVVNVTYKDATAYCKWAGGRLPTEAEWEKAARGADSRVYPWGSEWNPQLCNWAEGGNRDGYERTAPVESFLVGASPYYCVNMVGNVWEWCSDWFDPSYYRISPADNPTGPDKRPNRVVRGGGFDFNLRGNPRCAMRTSAPPREADVARGFRCVVDNAD